MGKGGSFPAALQRESNYIVKQLAILGSTGSIGRQCLSVVEAMSGRFGVVALAAGANIEELIGQIERHRPEVVSVGDAKRADELVQRLREKGVSPIPQFTTDARGCSLSERIRKLTLLYPRQ